MGPRSNVQLSPGSNVQWDGAPVQTLSGNGALVQMFIECSSSSLKLSLQAIR